MYHKCLNGAFDIILFRNSKKMTQSHIRTVFKNEKEKPNKNYIIEFLYSFTIMDINTITTFKCVNSAYDKDINIR